MARIKRFSEYFQLNKTQYELDFVDIPINNGDIPLFIDPYSISKRSDRWSIECHNLIVEYFQHVLDLIRSGQEAEALYVLAGLREPNETRLGLSIGKKPRGRGVGNDQAKQLYTALAKSTAVESGFIHSLEECELLIEGISSDKISDITTNIIRHKLIEYTQAQCELWGVETFNVPCSPLWDSNDKKWTSCYLALPTCNKSIVILVPKAITRYALEFDQAEYYNHSVLGYSQKEHLSASSSLVRTLKNGTKRPPYKKDLKKEYPQSKQFLYEFSKDHPDVLKKYVRSKGAKLQETTNETILTAINHPQPMINFATLKTELSQIPAGKKNENDYHNLAIGILTAIFYPALVYPHKEEKIHSGRKRIDITYTNAATDGFFSQLSIIKQVPSSYIIIECKNYNADPENPELDQLSGRFSVNRGKFGILLCRKFKNKALFVQRCRDTAIDGRGFIVPLDDKDLILLLKFKAGSNQSAINAYLDEAFRKLVM